MKRLLSLLLAVMLVMALAVPALAENKYEDVQTPDNLVAVTGTSMTFKKFLVVPAGASIPNVTFSYTIAAGEAISTDTSVNPVFQVDAGVDANKITISNTTFAPTDATYTAVQSSDIDVSRTADDRVSTLTADTGVQFETDKGEKYAVQTATVDFSQVTFVEPGVYRYIITETANAAHEAAGIMHDNDTTRVLDVYVVHKDGPVGTAVTEAWLVDGQEFATEQDAKAYVDMQDGTLSYDDIVHREASTPQAEGLEIAGYVLHKGAGSTGAWIDNPNIAIGTDMGAHDVDNDGDALPDKTDGFTNEYKPYDLVFKKEVSGNQASRDKYFEFTLTLTGLTEGDKYAVSIADDHNANTTDGNADATSGANNATIAANAGKTNVTELTAGAGGTVTQKFYLQHGQSIAVRGLPANAVYTVTENAEDYKSEGAKVTDHKNATNGKIGEQDTKMKTDGTTEDTAPDRIVYTSYLNTRNGVIPTGVAMGVGGAVAMLVLAAGYFLLRKKMSV